MRNKLIVVAIATGVSLAVFAGLWFRPQDQGPIYQGKTFMEWFHAVDASDGVSYEDPGVLAIIAMGAPATPYLIKIYRANLGTPNPMAYYWNENVPRRWRIKTAQSRNLIAYVGLMKLGPLAESAIPELIEMARNSDDVDTIQLLGYIHRRPATCVPFLSHLIESRQNEYYAAQAIGEFRREAAKAVPVLRPLLTDSNFNVRETAAMAILKIHGGDSQALQLLAMDAATNASGSLFINALAFDQFGTNDHWALPLLTNLLTNVDSTIQTNAMNAMRDVLSTQ